MTIDERVGRLVDQKTGELLDLFQESGDRTKDLSDKLDRLIHSLPLLQDIKSEVAEIQKLIPNKDDDDDEDDNQDEPETDESNPEIDKFLEELVDSLLDVRSLNGGDLLDSPKYPALPGWMKGSSKPSRSDKDYVRLVYYIWKKVKGLRDAIMDGIKENLSRNQIEYIVNTVRETKMTTDLLFDAAIRRLDEISDDLQECCENTEQLLNAMGSDITTIKRKVSELSPEADNNKDLALQARSKAILAEVQTIRGLL